MSKIDDNCNIDYLEAREKRANRLKEEADECNLDESNPAYRRAAVLSATIKELKGEGVSIPQGYIHSTLGEKTAKNYIRDFVGFIKRDKKITPEDCPEELRAKAKEMAVQASKDVYGNERAVDHYYKLASCHLAAIAYLKGKLQKNEEKLYPDREKDTVTEYCLRDYLENER